MKNNILKTTTALSLASLMVLPNAQAAVAADGMTRGEVAEMLYEHSGESHDAGSSEDFSDVPTTSKYFEAISWMEKEGLSVGYKDGSFGVDRPVSRGEFSTFLYRHSGEKHPTPSKQKFPDVFRTSAHFVPIDWISAEGLIKGYTDKTFRPTRTVSHTEADTFLYAYDNRGQATAPPAPGPGSEGTGGSYTDAKMVSWSNGTVSSKYHIYSSHLDKTKPHGVIVYMHGDGGWEYNDLKYSPTPEWVKIAKENNLMLVVPKTPDSGGTWWKKDSSGDWVTDLYDHLGTKYNVDRSKAYWVGFSGGADTIAEQVISAHSDGWTGGAALMMGGGSMWGQPQKPISATLKKSFPMHYLVGTNDTGPEYDAKSAAENSHKIYTDYGMTTKLSYIQGGNHTASAKAGPEYFRNNILK